MDLDGLVSLLALDGATVPFSGVLEELGDDGVRRWAVRRNGRLARIEQPPGTLSLIAGHRTYWRSWPVDPGIVAIPREPGDEDFDFGILTSGSAPERYWRGWLTQDRDLVESTLVSTTHETRPAWQFDVPSTKGGAPTMTVDAELGMVVKSERSDVGVFRLWTDLRTDDRPDDDVFRYDGPWQRVANLTYPDGWAPE